jgi:hypothetical protein
MPKTLTTTRTIDLVLRWAEVRVTASGYRLVLHCHEVESLNGQPVGTTEKVYEDDGGVGTAKLTAEIDKILKALQTRDYS